MILKIKTGLVHIFKVIKICRIQTTEIAEVSKNTKKAIQITLMSRLTAKKILIFVGWKMSLNPILLWQTYILNIFQGVNFSNNALCSIT